MRHLVTSLLLVAAVLTYAAGFGPLFFGEPLAGSMLITAAILLECAFWWRVMHKTKEPEDPHR
ncbi:MAG TPA: glycosyl transferase family 39 [Rhodanobacter sp.]|nr:glycosyl transferase family 39 [Rhodanobacter sp.]